MKTRKRAKRPASPVMVECPECFGHAEVQAHCDMCGEPLTEENVEPGTDDLCRECHKQESA